MACMSAMVGATAFQALMAVIVSPRRATPGKLPIEAKLSTVRVDDLPFSASTALQEFPHPEGARVALGYVRMPMPEANSTDG